MTTRGYSDKWLRLAGIPLIGLSMPFLFGPQRPLTDVRFWYSIMLSLSMTFVLWEGNRFIIMRLRRVVSWERSPYKRIIEQVALSVSFTTVAVFVLYRLFMGVVGLSPGGLGNALLATLALTILMNAVYEAMYFTARWRYAFMRAEVLKREGVRAQLESLKNQVNPRFLFNSLNALTSLIDTDQKRAASFVQDMARVYRYTLQSKDWPLVSVEKEITFLKAYIRLLKERFGEALQINITLPEKVMTTAIPPLTLQFLIENAIRHNEASADHPLIITIMDGEDKIHVTNTLQRKAGEQRSPRMDIKEIQARYSGFTAESVLDTEDENTFKASLPVLRQYV